MKKHFSVLFLFTLLIPSLQAQDNSAPVISRKYTVTKNIDKAGKVTYDTIITESAKYELRKDNKYPPANQTTVVESRDNKGNVTYDTVEIYSPQATVHDDHPIFTENELNQMLKIADSTLRTALQGDTSTLRLKLRALQNALNDSTLYMLDHMMGQVFKNFISEENNDNNGCNHSEQNCDGQCMNSGCKNHSNNSLRHGSNKCSPPQCHKQYLPPMIINGPDDCCGVMGKMPDFEIKNYQRNKNIGIGLLTGGAVVGVGGLSMFAFSFVKKDANGERYFAEDPNPVLAIVGGGVTLLGTAAMTTGAAMTIINSIKLNRVRGCVNDGRCGSLNMISNQNGLGLALRF